MFIHMVILENKSLLNQKLILFFKTQFFCNNNIILYIRIYIFYI